MERVYNFSAGPGVLPELVLEEAKRDMLNWKGRGLSVMEMSHRSPAFKEIFESAKQGMKDALSVPDTHEILFLQGGATLQFAAIPMNLMDGGCADYAVTGNFSNKAAIEAKKYGSVNIAYSSVPEHDRIPVQSELKLSEDARYFYYCANNTIYGTEWQYVPEAPCPVVCDMSSDILSRPVDVSKFGLIYAGAQKNMAPAGLTVVIIDKSLAGHELPFTPQIMSYKTMIEQDSMLNTPPCWCIYMLSLVLDWVKSQGGVSAMEQLRTERAEKLYSFLDGSSLFRAHAHKDARSFMNVTFRTGNEELDAEFVKGAEKLGMINLKGHKLSGGMRASIYNAMPIEGVERLVEYMKEFEYRHV